MYSGFKRKPFLKRESALPMGYNTAPPKCSNYTFGQKNDLASFNNIKMYYAIEMCNFIKNFMVTQK